MKKYNIKLLVFLAFFCVGHFVPKMALAQGSIVISQIQITGGEGKTKEDFIELYNPSTENFNLKGFRLVKRTQSGTSDTLIKSWTDDVLVGPGSFYLWANSDFTSIASVPNATSTATIAADNGIAIRFGANDTGEIIDSVSWGAADNSFRKISDLNAEAGQGFLRQESSNPTSAFNIAAPNPHSSPLVSSAQDNNNPAPVVNETPSGAGQGNNTQNSNTAGNGNSGQGNNQNTNTVTPKTYTVKISEIFPNPEGEDEAKEQVELINTGSTAVNLDGWLLQDKTDSGPKASAFKIEGVVMAPSSVVIFTIPKGKFVLNNTKGDEVNLYFADGSLADKAAYAEDAKEGWSYQKLDSGWVWQKPSLGQKNSLQAESQTSAPAASPAAQSKTAASATTSATFYAIKSHVNEFLPDPEGVDEGREWIEIYNPSKESENLKGFIFDDSGKEGPSSNAWVLGESVIQAEDYLLLTIPEDKFALNNSGKDVLRFFSPDKKLISEISYEAPEENRSWQKNKDGQWVFGLPSPGKNNLPELPPVAKIKISEILPYPDEGQDEFIELVNLTNEPVAMGGFVIKVGSRKFTFEEGGLDPKGFLAVYEEDLGLHFSNGGQKVELIDPFGRSVDFVSYPQSKKGLVYASLDSGFVWSELPTPGEQNKLVLAAQASADEKNEVTEEGLATTTPGVIEDSESASSSALSEFVANSSQPKSAPKKSSIFWLALAALAFVAFVWLLVKSGFIKLPKKQPPHL